MSDTDLVRVHRALLSLSDKSGLDALVAGLQRHTITLISTGGTAQAIANTGAAVTEIAEVTEMPEMMDGRVKTLHPKIHGGLLALRHAPAHQQALRDHDIAPIDLLIVNLYPFNETVAKGADFDQCIENIDIGGPAMIRSAAKNHAAVAVVTTPADYETLLEALDRHDGCLPAELRRQWAHKAFAHTAAYDASISAWFAAQLGDTFPAQFSLSGQKQLALRYGENPHQQAALYRTLPARAGAASAAQRQGKALSYNNLNDTDAAFELVAAFDPDHGAACAIIKHANPCGVAIADTLADAYQKALACDPVSAFGGIIAFNRALDAGAAAEITKIFTEVIIAPGASAEAEAIIAEKKNLRLLLTDGLPDPAAASLTAKTIAGGLLVQSRDARPLTPADLRIVSRRQPSQQQLDDMLFAFTVAGHVKSNAIVYAKDRATVGIGAGQMSRVDSARLGAWKAQAAAGDGESLAQNAVAASDAFFPFADGLETLVAAGATAVIQPGGSMRDDDVIAAADAAGIAMVFTGIRHFRH